MTHIAVGPMTFRTATQAPVAGAAAPMLGDVDARMGAEVAVPPTSATDGVAALASSGRTGRHGHAVPDDAPDAASAADGTQRRHGLDALRTMLLPVMVRERRRAGAG